MDDRSRADRDAWIDASYDGEQDTDGPDGPAPDEPSGPDEGELVVRFERDDPPEEENTSTPGDQATSRPAASSPRKEGSGPDRPVQPDPRPQAETVREGRTNGPNLLAAVLGGFALVVTFALAAYVALVHSGNLAQDGSTDWILLGGLVVVLGLVLVQTLAGLTPLRADPA